MSRGKPQGKHSKNLVTFSYFFSCWS